MTNAGLIAALQALPLDLDVCVTTDASRETLEAQLVDVVVELEGTYIVITGLEDLKGVLG